MKKSTLFVPLAAAALVLSACGDNDASQSAGSDATSNPTSTATVSSETSEHPDDGGDEGGDSGEAGAGGETYSAQAAVDAFIATHEGANAFEEVPPGFESLEGDELVVDPAECAAALSVGIGAERFDGAELGGASFVDEANQVTMSFLAAEYADADSVGSLLEQYKTLVPQCGSIEMVLWDGQVQVNTELHPESVAGADDTMLSSQYVLLEGITMVQHLGVVTLGNLELVLTANVQEGDTQGVGNVQTALEQVITELR